MYTDQDLKAGTQIAYLSFIRKSNQSLLMQDKKGPFTISQLIKEAIDVDAAMEKAIKAGVDPENITIQELVKYSDLSKSDKEIIEKLTPETFEWKVSNIRDANNRNGFYALVLETSEKSAIIAIRGSETCKKFKNLVLDWIKCDFGLLKNREGTPQQQEVERYIEYLQNNGFLDKYDNIAVTGHSLGGNLADHAGVISAKEGYEKFASKLTQVVSFDGPGFSKNYMEYYSKEIEKSMKNVKEFKKHKWSAVGDLLYDLPGQETDYLPINLNLHRDNLIDRFKYKCITRHHTEAIMFDEDGNAIKGGKIDPVAKVLSKISKTAEDIIPDEVAYGVYMATMWCVNHLLEVNKDGTYQLKSPVKLIKGAIGKVSNGILNVVDGIENVYLGACNSFVKRDKSFANATQNAMNIFNKNDLSDNLEMCY